MRQALALALAGLLALSGCAQVAPGPAAPSPPPSRDDVVHATGHDGVQFGASRAAIEAHLNRDLPGCNTQLRGRPEASLVFAPDERAVLMWFDAPLQTPAGINTGDKIADVSNAYPNATPLRAPAGSHRFDGILVTYGEHGYLFLHDGKTVQKAIAGYVDYLHRLFDAGFGVC